MSNSMIRSQKQTIDYDSLHFLATPKLIIKPLSGRSGRIYYRDAGLSIWDDLDANNQVTLKPEWMRDFFDQVYRPMLDELSNKGWCFADDLPLDAGACFAHHLCRKGDLHGETFINGRCIEFNMWQNLTNISRPDGNGKFESNKERRMPFLMKLDMERTRRHLKHYFCSRFGGYRFE